MQRGRNSKGLERKVQREGLREKCLYKVKRQSKEVESQSVKGEEEKSRELEKIVKCNSQQRRSV